jgi:heme o synthase
MRRIPNGSQPHYLKFPKLMNTRVEVSSAQDLRSTALAMWQLTKPGVSRLVFFTTWFGAALAPGPCAWRDLVFTVLGTWLIVASANTLNMYLEHDVDALMERTRTRPLPAGKLSREVALGFGLSLGVAGLLVLGLLVNGVTLLIGAFALITYAGIYTPLKAKSSFALYVGAVPGALPPVLGYTGMFGALDAVAVAIFAVLFVWQIPHFLAITVFRRDEYARAGLKVMPVTMGLPATVLAVKVSTVVLILSTLTPFWAGIGNPWYVGAAIAGAVGFGGWVFVGQRLLGDKQPVELWARRVFLASMPYLIVLYGTLALSA